MNQTLYGKQRATFNFTTLAIITNLCCCRHLKSQESLRKNPKGRNMLYFNKGLERMNKECDLAYIVKHIRILRFFLRTVLDKD